MAEAWNESDLDPGQLADFLALEPPMRSFVLKVLDGTAEDGDWSWFGEPIGSRAVAQWLETLPAFRTARIAEDHAE